MLVSFKRDWFGPDGALRSVRNNPHDLDEDLVESVPKDAIVQDDPKPEAPKAPPVKPKG